MAHQVENRPFVIGLNGHVSKHNIPSDVPARQASVHDLIALFGVVFDANRFHQPAAVGHPISWKDVEVNRIQAAGTVISTRSFTGLYKQPAMPACE